MVDGVSTSATPSRPVIPPPSKQEPGAGDAPLSVSAEVAVPTEQALRGQESAVVGGEEASIPTAGQPAAAAPAVVSEAGPEAAPTIESTTARESAPATAPATGAGTRGAAAPAMPGPPSNGTPAELLAVLANAPATKAAASLTAVENASPAALDMQREEAQAALPAIPTPTGLPAGRPSPRGETENVDRRAPRSAGKGAPTAARTKPQEKQDVKVPEAPPPPSLRPTVLVGGDAPPAPTSGSTAESQRDSVMERSAQAAVENVNLPLELMPTNPGPPPEVDLSGEADPVQMDQAEQAAEADVAARHVHALSEAGVGRGENDIRPQPDDEVLQAKLTATAGSTPGGMGGKGAEKLPPEVLLVVDAQATPILHQRIGVETEKYDAAQADYQTDTDAAHATATADIRQLETEARATQEGAREEARDEVTNARTDWRSEVEEVHQTFRTEAASASDEHRQQIRGHVETGNREAQQHMQKAEQDAAAETQKAEAEAENKKEEAREESGGFWGWVKSKAKALVDGLKQAVNFIYDNLRKAIKALFEAAKKLAMAALELARTAIVGLIKALGVALKALVSVALAAFPDIRDKAHKRIDAAVDNATEVVNQAAAALKSAVAAVLDFLASTIDKLLELVQDIYNGVLTVVGMIVSGELAEFLQRLDNLWAAAKTAPGQFETAAYEELLGGNLDEPLSPAELVAADGKKVDTPQAPWTEDNVGVENVVSGVELSPELSAELVSRAGENGKIEFGQSQDADRSLESILGAEPGRQPRQAPIRGQEGEQVKAPDGLTPHERAEVKWTIMKQGLAKWWSDNWPYVIGGGIAAVAAFIAANILTGGAVAGAILTALPTIMTVVGPLFAGVMVVQLVGHLRDFLEKGWNGDARGGGKALAKGLAAGAIELISWLTFKAGSVAMKGARAAAKGAVKGAQAAGRVGAKAVEGGMNLVKRGAHYVIKNGKVLLRGAGDATERNVKNLRELGERLLARTKFRGFRIKLNGRRFRLEGLINPWVLLADGTIKWENTRGHGRLGASTTVDGQEALVIGRAIDDTALKNIFQARPQAANDLWALARRTDVELRSILQRVKNLDPENAEQLLKQLNQFKEVDRVRVPGGGGQTLDNSRIDLIRTLIERNKKIKAVRGNSNEFKNKFKLLTSNSDTPRDISAIAATLDELLTSHRRVRIERGGGRYGRGVSTVIESLDGRFSIRITHNQVGVAPVGTIKLPRIHVKLGPAKGHKHVLLTKGTTLTDILNALNL